MGGGRGGRIPRRLRGRGGLFPCGRVVVVVAIAVLVVAFAVVALDICAHERDIYHPGRVATREQSLPTEVPANPSPEIIQRDCCYHHRRRRRIRIPLMSWMIPFHHHDDHDHLPCHCIFYWLLHFAVFRVGIVVSEF